MCCYGVGFRHQEDGWWAVCERLSSRRVFAILSCMPDMIAGRCRLVRHLDDCMIPMGAVYVSFRGASLDVEVYLKYVFSIS